MIEACSATLEYEDHGRAVFACKEINLEVQRGEFLGILGPSGSGKSSLLYLLSGLKTPTSGDIQIGGRSFRSMNDIERSNLRLKKFGFVFQHSFLLSYLNAEENVIAASAENSVTMSRELLERLGLSEKRHRRPHELSGGERQRVCVARALVNSPEAIFADEPTASLDHKNGIHVMKLLNELRGAGSLVTVTHDESMLENADRIIRISDGMLTE